MGHQMNIKIDIYCALCCNTMTVGWHEFSNDGASIHVAPCADCLAGAAIDVATENAALTAQRDRCACCEAQDCQC